MDLGLKDRRALVTASSKGIGFGVARALAREGARVAMCARDATRLGQAASRIGRNAVALPADLTDPEAVDRLVADAASALGGLDILVSNTGSPPPSSFAENDDALWRDAVDLTLMSAIRLARAALPHLEASGSGRILFVASVSIKQPVAGLVLSNAPRSGLLGLSKTLASDLAPRGIRVNLLLPGFTWTDRVRILAETLAEREKVPVETIHRRWEADIPMGRLAEPDEIASVASFLVSDRASYVTGTAVQVDGGYVRSVL